MSPNEQRIIHEAATDASQRILNAANLMNVSACVTRDTNPAQIMMTGAITELRKAADSLHVLFVELNKAQKGAAIAGKISLN